MTSLLIAALFVVAGLASALVLGHALAMAIPAWRNTRAQLAACPAYREATVRVEYRYVSPALPRRRARKAACLTAKRRVRFSQGLPAAA